MEKVNSEYYEIKKLQSEISRLEELVEKLGEGLRHEELSEHALSYSSKEALKLFRAWKAGKKGDNV